MRKIGKKKLIVAGVATAVIAAGAGTALAYWTTTGSGQGTATTGTSTNWNVTIDSTTTGDLSPDGPTDVISFHVQNPGSGVQNLQNTVATVTGTSNPGCGAADFYAPVTSITYGSVAAGATVDGTFTLRMKDTGVDQEACKGATVNLNVDAS